MQRRYVYGLQRVTQTQGGVTSYYRYDGQGYVRFLMNAAGAVTDKYDYDAFGNLISGAGTTANVYRYQGEALDSETGLYYLRARYYDLGTGRFLSVDPMADQGEHPYSYAGADPINGHDPTGQQEIIEYALTLWLAWVQPIPLHSTGSCFGAILVDRRDIRPIDVIQAMEACLAIAQSGKGGGPGGPGKRDRVKIRVRVIEDGEAHEKHPINGQSGLYAWELNKEQAMLDYAKQALSNTEVDVVSGGVLHNAQGLMLYRHKVATPGSDPNSINIVVSTVTPAGHTGESTCENLALGCFMFINIDRAYAKTNPLHAQTMVHEFVHILTGIGEILGDNLDFVDILAFRIINGAEVDLIKNGARNRPFTIQ